MFDRIKTHFLITGDYVRKSLVISYFLNNPNLLKLYDLPPEELVDEVMGLDGPLAYALSANDLIKALEMPRSSISVERINAFAAKNPHYISQGVFRYYIFFDEGNFSELSGLYEEWFRKRPAQSPKDLVDFVEALHKNPGNIDLLNRMVLYIDPINRVLTLSSILLEFRSQLLHKLIPERLEQLGYPYLRNFISGYSLRRDGRFQSITSFAIMSLYDKENEIDFPHIDSVKRLFDELPQVDGFVVKEDLILKLRNDEYLSNKQGEPIRSPPASKKAPRHLARETLQDLLDRVESESEAWIDWGELRQYFTRRGFPMFAK